MPEVQYLDQPFRLMNPVIDHDRTVHQLPHLLPSANRCANSREFLKNFDVIKEGVAEALSGFGIIFCNMRDDLF